MASLEKMAGSRSVSSKTSKHPTSPSANPAVKRQRQDCADSNTSLNDTFKPFTTALKSGKRPESPVSQKIPCQATPTDTDITHQSSGWTCAHEPERRTEVDEESEASPPPSSIESCQIITPTAANDNVTELGKYTASGYIDGLHIQTLLDGKRLHFSAPQKRQCAFG